MANPPPYKVRELCKGGGANRDRTDDLYNAIVALSQLSYGPFNHPTLLDDSDFLAARPYICKKIITMNNFG